MIDAPSGGAPEQALRWDLVDTESYGGGIRFLAPYLIVWGYVDMKEICARGNNKVIIYFRIS